MFKLLLFLSICLSHIVFSQRIGLEVELIYQHNNQETHLHQAPFEYAQRRAQELETNLEINQNVELHYDSFTIAAKNEDRSSAYITFNWDQEKNQFSPSIELNLPQGEIERGVEDDFQKLSRYIMQRFNSNGKLSNLIKGKNPQEEIWKELLIILESFPTQSANYEKILQIINKKNKTYSQLSYGFEQFDKPVDATPTVSIRKKNNEIAKFTFTHDPTIEKPDETYRTTEVVFEPIESDYDYKFNFISSLMESKNPSNQSVFEPHPTAGVHFHLEVIDPKLLKRVLVKRSEEGDQIAHKHVNSFQYTQDLEDLRKEFVKFKSVLQKLLFKDENGTSLHQLMVKHFSNEFRQQGLPEAGIKGRAKKMQDRTFINTIEAIDQIIKELDSGESNLYLKERLHHFFENKLTHLLPIKGSYASITSRIMHQNPEKKVVGFGTLEFRAADSQIIQDKQVMRAHLDLFKKIGDPEYNLTQNDLKQFVSYSLHQNEAFRSSTLADEILRCSKK